MVLLAWVFVFALILSTVLLFATVFFIILFSDLECDYINPAYLCSNLNKLVIPEYAIHGVLSFVLLTSGLWLELAWNIPLVAYHAYKYIHNKMFYEPTEVFKVIGDHKTELFAKLSFYALSFFIYLYRLVSTIVRQN